MSGSDDVRALINHYARAGYARHVQTTCAEALRERRGDGSLSFWRAYGMIMEGSYSEAIMQLESLRGCVATVPGARAVARAAPPPPPPAPRLDRANVGEECPPEGVPLRARSHDRSPSPPATASPLSLARS